MASFREQKNSFEKKEKKTLGTSDVKNWKKSEFLTNSF